METVEKKKRSTVSKAMTAEIEALRKRLIVVEADNKDAEECIGLMSGRNRFLALIIAFESFTVWIMALAIVMLLRR